MGKLICVNGFQEGLLTGIEKTDVQRGGYFQKRKKAGIFSGVVVRIHWDRKAECAIRHSGEMASTESKSED